MTFEDAARKALEFRDERDWKQFHNPKDLAISISLEANELLETFQWSGADTDVTPKREHMTEELADVLIYCVYMADAIGADIPAIMDAKIDRNARKYTIEKSKGTSKKYTELD
jgi:NTP pyrophosphatase (non-canonical NTP hydrolase)